MTNIDRAVKHILDTEEKHRGHNYDVYPDDLRRWMQALADAGYLMPDLPGHVVNEYNGNPSWFNGWVEQDWGEVELHHFGYANGDNDTSLTTQDARQLALALLAAANYAERNQA